MPTIGASTRIAPSVGRRSAAGSAGTRRRDGGRRAGGAAAGTGSSVRRTVTRVPASSIVDLGDAGLLDDPHDLADPLGPRLVDAAGEQRLLAARAAADRAQQRLGLVAEQREQEQLLLARGEPLGLVAHGVERDRLVGRLPSPRDERRRRAGRSGSIGPGGVPKRPARSSRSSSTTVW